MCGSIPCEPKWTRKCLLRCCFLVFAPCLLLCWPHYSVSTIPGSCLFSICDIVCVLTFWMINSAASCQKFAFAIVLVPTLNWIQRHFIYTHDSGCWLSFREWHKFTLNNIRLISMCVCVCVMYFGRSENEKNVQWPNTHCIRYDGRVLLPPLPPPPRLWSVELGDSIKGNNKTENQ